MVFVILYAAFIVFIVSLCRAAAHGDRMIDQAKR